MSERLRAGAARRHEGALGEVDASLDETREAAACIVGMLARGEGADLGSLELAKFPFPDDSRTMLHITWHAECSGASVNIDGNGQEQTIDVRLIERVVEVLTNDVLPRARAYLANERKNLETMLGTAGLARTGAPAPAAAQSTGTVNA